MNYKTTKQHFELFKRYFKHYQDLFELNNYQIHFFHQKGGKWYAEITTNQIGHCSRVTFNTTWIERGPTEDKIRKDALHECCHLLISKLEWLAGCRYLDEVEIDETQEELVVKMASAIERLTKK